MVTIVKVYFDDWELTKYCHVRNITPYLQPSRNNVFQTHPDRDGAYFKKSTLGQAVVDIKVSIRSNTLNMMDAINRMLAVREPKKLFIDDRPDRYLLAILDSNSIPVKGRYYASTFTLKFISPNSYWNSTEGLKKISLGSSGRAILGAVGTADSPVSIDIDFEEDCGHLAIITPTTHISIGNPDEVDTIMAPPSEFAINEEMTSMSNWTKIILPELQAIIGNDSTINDLNPVQQPKNDQWGLIVDQTWNNTNNKWNGVSYKKDFDTGVMGANAINFKHKSRVDFEDMTGGTKSTIRSNYFIYDENNRILMGMTIEDISLSSNSLAVWLWAAGKDGNGKPVPSLVEMHKIPRLRGWIAMEKMGDTFTWKVHNEKGNPSTPVATAPPSLKVGDIVQLNNSATTIYDWSGRALRLNNVIKGINLRVSAIRNSPKGKYQLTNVAKGWVEGFFELDAIQQKAVPKPTPASPAPNGFTVVKTMREMAQRSGKGFIVGLYKWGAGAGYTAASINSVVVQRIHTQNLYDIPNTFMAGDKLSIEDGEILLNGSIFNGQMSYDSRPLKIEGGVPSEVALLPSSWAKMPKATLTYESRWL